MANIENPDTRDSHARRRGFEAPFTLDQMVSWILQPAVYICFFVMCSTFLNPETAALILIPYAILVLIFGTCWYYCSSTDPSDATIPIYTWDLLIPDKPERFCTVCSKSSPGLDHHCTWLNTCISANTYGPFLILILTATLKMLFQTIIGIVMITSWFDTIMKNQQSPARIEFLFWAHNILSGGLTIAYGSLLGFHVYLLYHRMGTYDWLLRGKQQRMVQKKSKQVVLPPTDPLTELEHKKDNVV